MSSIFQLQEIALTNIQRAIDAVTRIPPDVNGRDYALGTLKDMHSKLTSILLDNYLDLKKAKASTAEYFDEPIEKLIEKIIGKSILDLPHDLAKMRKSQTRTPDRQVLSEIHALQTYLQRSYRALRLLQNSKLRIITSWWIVAAIFGIALLYAVWHFVFVKSGVSHPFSENGPKEILESAQTNITDIKTAIGNSNGILDAGKIFIKKLTELISAIPALLAAIGAVYAACRKLLI